MNAGTLVDALWATPVVAGYAAVFAGFILLCLRVRDRMDQLDAEEAARAAEESAITMANDDSLIPTTGGVGAWLSFCDDFRLRQRQKVRR